MKVKFRVSMNCFFFYFIYIFLFFRRAMFFLLKFYLICIRFKFTDKMRLVILPTSPSVGEWSAKYVMKRINDFHPGPDKYFVLGLPTGSTPLSMYKKLIEFYKNGRVSFKYVKTFNMDEYVGEL